VQKNRFAAAGAVLSRGRAVAMLLGALPSAAFLRWLKAVPRILR
jgi:hypothetical protein